MTYRIRLRRSISTDWTAANPVLGEGEAGIESDTRYFKFGTGTLAWNDLPYAIGPGDLLPEAVEEDDGKIIITFGGQWTVADLPSGLPDPTGVPDGYMIATVGEAWVVQAIPSSPTELPNPAGLPDGKLLGTVSEEWVAVDAPESGGSGGRAYYGNVPGVLAAATGTNRIYNDSGTTLTIASVRASVAVAPTGAPIVVDVNKNDVSIFPSSTKPTIAASTTTNKRTPDTTAWADGEYLTVDIDSVGTTVAGSNLTVLIEVA